jgi:GNAT superfamily N-acetyltransferase
MVKRRPQQDVTEQDDALEQMAEDAPLAPEQEYEITLFRPEHALGVSRCIYRVYGNTYMHEDCYYPDRLVQLNRTGELVSVVALDESGDVVGHYALERPRLTRVAERGMAVVSPDHRGRDIMGRMRVHIEEEARRLGLIGVFSVAVTLHTYSQRVNEEYGSDVTGIYLGGGPGNMVFKKIAGEAPGQRVTWVIYHTYVQPPELSVVHAPPHHRSIMERIYAGLPVEVEFRDGGPIPEIEGEVEVTYSHSQDNATIRIRRIGEDTCPVVRRATEDLFNITGAEVVFVEIPLAQAAAPELCAALESEGFYFQGIGPSFAGDGDALILGKLNVPLDPFQARIENPFAQELLHYIAAERERVTALAGASA